MCFLWEIFPNFYDNPEREKTSVPSAISTPISPSRLAAWHGHFKQAVLTMLPFLATRTTNQRLELNPTPQGSDPMGTMGPKIYRKIHHKDIWMHLGETNPTRGGDSSLFWMGEMGSGATETKGAPYCFLRRQI